MADAPRRRQAREALAEALHASALVIDRHDERRGARRVDPGYQRGELPGVGIVACEEHHAADERMAQQLALRRAERCAHEVDHEGPEAHRSTSASRAQQRQRLDVRGVREHVDDARRLECEAMFVHQHHEIPRQAPRVTGNIQHPCRREAARAPSTARAPVRGGSSSTWL